jgi:hypothetical protein
MGRGSNPSAQKWPRCYCSNSFMGKSIENFFGKAPLCVVDHFVELPPINLFTRERSSKGLLFTLLFFFLLFLLFLLLLG